MAGTGSCTPARRHRRLARELLAAANKTQWHKRLCQSPAVKLPYQSTRLTRPAGGAVSEPAVWTTTPFPAPPLPPLSTPPPPSLVLPTALASPSPRLRRPTPPASHNCTTTRGDALVGLFVLRRLRPLCNALATPPPRLRAQGRERMTPARPCEVPCAGYPGPDPGHDQPGPRPGPRERRGGASITRNSSLSCHLAS